LAKDGYEVGDRVPGRILHARYSQYMAQVAELEPELVAQLAEHGARFTHHSSIAPTGTISLSMGNNASNGIEPSFSHRYFRNIIQSGKKTKEQVEVVSFELAAYRHFIAADAVDSDLPDYFVTADAISPEQHVAYLREQWARFEPFTDGWYANEVAEEAAGIVDRNYQGNHARLVQVKKRYDPGNLFRLNANVSPTG